MSEPATPSMPAFAYALATVRSCFDSLRGLEACVRAGDDPEAVHDMRVGTRRLRGLMSTFEPVLPEDFQPLRQELKWLGAELGAVRDLDVQMESLREASAGLRDERLVGMSVLLECLGQQRNEAQAELVVSLTSQRYADLTAGLTMALSAPSATEDDEPVKDFAPQIIRRRYRKLRKAARELWPDSLPPAFHATRIRAKRLRYTLEAFEPLYGRPAVELAEEATAVQDRLGKHQDLIVLNQRLERMVLRGKPLPPWALVVAGELMERNQRRAASIREGWSGLGTVKRRWRRLKSAL